MAGEYATADRGRPVLLPGGGGGTTYNGQYGMTRPEWGTFIALQVYKRVGISQVMVYGKAGKSVI